MSTTWPLGGPAGACSGTSDATAGSWRASRRPEWPSLVARHTFEVGLLRRETAAHSLQSDQGGAAAAVSAVGKIGPTEAVRPDTRSAGGELTESPRSRPTRLCRADGSPQHSVETPARAARPSEPLWGSAPAGEGPSSTARCRTHSATTGQVPASSGATEAWRAPSRACHRHLRNAFNTLDVRTGHREGVAPRRTYTSAAAPMQT